MFKSHKWKFNKNKLTVHFHECWWSVFSYSIWKWNVKMWVSFLLFFFNWKTEDKRDFKNVRKVCTVSKQLAGWAARERNYIMNSESLVIGEYYTRVPDRKDVLEPHRVRWCSNRASLAERRSLTESHSLPSKLGRLCKLLVFLRSFSSGSWSRGA
jgi:hypothetical protein